jgi:hypothetical protein
MWRSDEQETLIRKLASEVVGWPLPDDLPMRTLLGDRRARRRVAQAINGLTPRFAKDVPGNSFAGVVNEFADRDYENDVVTFMTKLLECNREMAHEPDVTLMLARREMS